MYITWPHDRDAHSAPHNHRTPCNHDRYHRRHRRRRHHRNAIIIVTIISLPSDLQANAKPGDWFCPVCVELNFASRQQCRKCNGPRPAFTDPTIGTKPGDWFCLTCHDLNFASRTTCRRCNSPHPAGQDPALRLMYAQAVPANVKPGLTPSRTLSPHSRVRY